MTPKQNQESKPGPVLYWNSIFQTFLHKKPYFDMKTLRPHAAGEEEKNKRKD